MAREGDVTTGQLILRLAILLGILGGLVSAALIIAGLE